MEETLQIEQGNHLYLLAYADLLSAMGDNSLALTYYCSALEFSDVLRGWYGVFYCCDPLQDAALRKMAKSKLLSAYKTHASDLSCKIIKAYLDD